MADALVDARVLVYGVGVAGTSAARALLVAGADVALTAAAPGPSVADLTAAGARWLGHASSELPDVDLVVVSPGVRPTDPLRRRRRSTRGVPVWGEAELAWRLRPDDAAPWLAVTGTNGKTTTVHMLEAMLRAAGLHALAVGNVGVPLIDAVIAPEPYDVLAVELSSQQLHFAPSIRPAAGALLNLAPDHLDWHGSFEDYAMAKSAVWFGAVAIGNADDPLVAQLLQTAPGEHVVVHPGRTGAGSARRRQRASRLARVRRRRGGARRGRGRPSGRRAQRRERAGRRGAGACHRRRRRGGRCRVGRVRPGPAPQPDRCAAAAASPGSTTARRPTRTPPRARCCAYDRVVWIAGGQLKGAAVDELVAQVAPRLAGAVLLGVDRAVIADALRRHAPDVPVIEVATNDDGAMLEVVRAAAGLARPGDTVLLAPAGASYDMFANYAARGDAFAAAVDA